MSQVQCDYIAELLGKLAECVKKLAAEQADNLRLREALEYHQAQTRPIQRTEEALSATADLGEYTLCEKEPVAWLHENRPDADVITHAVKNVWNGVVVGRMAQYSIPLYAQKGLTKW
ncbi:MAG: hypothetical protein IPG22_06365 [Acidobacteria bacterium]|nr:hypothetical protein [Acidobacteriota bacterium]